MAKTPYPSSGRGEHHAAYRPYVPSPTVPSQDVQVGDLLVRPSGERVLVLTVSRLTEGDMDMVVYGARVVGAPEWSAVGTLTSFSVAVDTLVSVTTATSPAMAGYVRCGECDFHVAGHLAFGRVTEPDTVRCLDCLGDRPATNLRAHLESIGEPWLAGRNRHDAQFRFEVEQQVRQEALADRLASLGH